MSHPVGSVARLLDELFDLPDVLGDVAEGRELRRQVLHLRDLIVERRDGVQQVLHCERRIAKVNRGQKKAVKYPKISFTHTTQKNVPLV